MRLKSFEKIRNIQIKKTTNYMLLERIHLYKFTVTEANLEKFRHILLKMWKNNKVFYKNIKEAHHYQIPLN